MKKLIIAVIAAFAVSSVSLPAKADAGTSITALVMGFMFLAGHESAKPTPYNLTDACTAQTVKAKDGNYSFTSYDHCIKS